MQYQFNDLLKLIDEDKADDKDEDDTRTRRIRDAFKYNSSPGFNPVTD